MMNINIPSHILLNPDKIILDKYIKTSLELDNVDKKIKTLEDDIDGIMINIYKLIGIYLPKDGNFYYNHYHNLPDHSILMCSHISPNMDINENTVINSFLGVEEYSKKARELILRKKDLYHQKAMLRNKLELIK